MTANTLTDRIGSAHLVAGVHVYATNTPAPTYLPERAPCVRCGRERCTRKDRPNSKQLCRSCCYPAPAPDLELDELTWRPRGGILRAVGYRARRRTVAA